MAEKYKNKYRIPSARAQWWDYGWNGAYFITICAHNRERLFGEIVDGRMILSHLGIIADILWYEIPFRSRYVELGDFVVMPNHMHGILILNRPAGDDDAQYNDARAGGDILRGDDDDVQTLRATSLHHHHHHDSPKNQKMAEISPKSNSISTIIRSYKSAVTKHANRLGLKNGWQTRFHDHIIRNDAEYQRISDYIVANPRNWEKDKFQSAE